MNTPTIAETGHATWTHCVRSDYDAGYIEALKQAIPHRERKWDGERKVWLFRRRHVDTVISLLRFYFGDYNYVRQGEDKAELLNLDTAFRVLYLQPTAPMGLVKVAHRYLAKQYHPDHGGDTATMQEINQAVHLIEGARSNGQD